jgi:hypothetical protein
MRRLALVPHQPSPIAADDVGGIRSAVRRGNIFTLWLTAPMDVIRAHIRHREIIQSVDWDLQIGASSR